MPFIAMNCTPELLSSLHLPEKLDEEHPYHYEILQHTDKVALLISQSHHHRDEVFNTEILVVGQLKLLINKKIHFNSDPWEYTLVGIRLYAEPADQITLKYELPIYLQDLLDDFRSRCLHTKVGRDVSLEVTSYEAWSRAVANRFDWCSS